MRILVALCLLLSPLAEANEYGSTISWVAVPLRETLPALGAAVCDGQPPKFREVFAWAREALTASGAPSGARYWVTVRIDGRHRRRIVRVP